MANELLRIYDESKRDDLQFLRDKCVNIFLQAVWKIPDFIQEQNDIKRITPIKNAYYTKTKLKSILYFISPKLYLYVHNIFDKGET